MKGSSTLGRLEGCQIWGNAKNGVAVESGDPTIAGCLIRDNGEYGVMVDVGAGKVTCEADCIFARNAEGSIVGRTR